MSVDVLTFGCRLNMVESQAMRSAAQQAGHHDLVIVNTCAVTAESLRQARQSIRRLGRERPQARIVVTGCGAQTAAQDFAAMPEVAQVIGNAEKDSPETWRALARDGEPGQNDTRKNRVTPIATQRILHPHAPSAIEGHTRAFLAVQNGCDHACTFCIIPQGRGPSRSLPQETVLAHCAALVASGAKEIVLTGVDLTSYGTDLPGAPRLGTLVQAILRACPTLPRLRLSSIDSVEADPALFEALRDEPRLMPHLHLSLQHGDDLILKRMKRRHTAAQGLDFCHQVRALRPDIALSADLIAGFPTETEAQFQNSLDLITQGGLAFVHVFPFSAREGTPAARMPQLPASLIKERAARLREAAAAALQNHLRKQVGKVLPVLTERGGLARTPDFTPVHFTGQHASAIRPNQLLDVAITALDNGKLRAEPL